jgi:hypothetical protein
MRKISLGAKGFGHMILLIVIVVLVAMVGAGAYTYHHVHDKKTIATVSTSTHADKNVTTTNSGSSTASSPYAGWDTYCDSIYHYCFKYPSGWQLKAATASQVGSTAQTMLQDPAKTVTVSYVNAFAHDNGPITFTPTYISKLSSANEDLTLVGGYSPASGIVGNYLPSYKVIDSSVLSTYPLTVGQSTQFPNNPSFTDNDTGNSTYQGQFIAVPYSAINTTVEAQTWLNSANAKTSLLILQSLYYK